MRILDYLFYMQVKLQMKFFLKRHGHDAAQRAALLNGLWFSFFILAVMTSTYLVFPQIPYLGKILSFFRDKPLRFVVFGLLVSAAMVLRYFKFVDYETIAEEIKRRRRQSTVSVICWIMWLVVPVCEFIIMRIYFDGQVRWW